MERLEDAVALLPGDARPAVADDEREAVPVLGHELHGPALRRVPDRVQEQVEQHLGQRLPRRRRDPVARVGLEPDARPVRPGRGEEEQVVEQRAQVRGRVIVRLRRRAPGHVQQVAHDPVDPAHLLHDHRRVATPPLWIHLLLGDPLRQRSDARQGVADLVGHRRGQLAHRRQSLRFQRAPGRLPRARGPDLDVVEPEPHHAHEDDEVDHDHQQRHHVREERLRAEDQGARHHHAGDDQQERDQTVRTTPFRHPRPVATAAAPLEVRPAPPADHMPRQRHQPERSRHVAGHHHYAQRNRQRGRPHHAPARSDPVRGDLGQGGRQEEAGEREHGGRVYHRPWPVPAADDGQDAERQEPGRDGREERRVPTDRAAAWVEQQQEARGQDVGAEGHERDGRADRIRHQKAASTPRTRVRSAKNDSTGSGFRYASSYVYPMTLRRSSTFNPSR